MFTKYNFTLTVILLINLCGCYTVTPSAKSASISGKDCNVSFETFSRKQKTKTKNSKLLHDGNFSIEDFFVMNFNPCLVVGDVVHTFFSPSFEFNFTFT